MGRQFSLSSNSVLVAWLVGLAAAGCAIGLFGPHAATIALFSKSDGLFITYGSLYALALSIAGFLTLLLLIWRMVGFSGIFETQPAEPAATANRPTVLSSLRRDWRL